MQKLLSIDEAASYLGRSVTALRHLVQREAIPVVRIGRRVQFCPQALDDFIAAKTGAPVTRMRACTAICQCCGNCIHCCVCEECCVRKFEWVDEECPLCLRRAEDEAEASAAQGGPKCRKAS